MLHADICRCLAHSPNGKPNGCDKSEHCARHLAIRSDDPKHNYTINSRRCTDAMMTAFIPADDVQ